MGEVHTPPVSRSDAGGVVRPGRRKHLPSEEFRAALDSMKGFLTYFGMSVGGWIGWALGAQVSIFTAYMVSMVGTGLGLFYTQRAVKRFLP